MSSALFSGLKLLNKCKLQIYCKKSISKNLCHVFFWKKSMIVCSFGYFSVPVVTKSNDKDANVASTTVDDRDANMETVSSASTCL